MTIDSEWKVTSVPNRPSEGVVMGLLGYEHLERQGEDSPRCLVATGSFLGELAGALSRDNWSAVSGPSFARRWVAPPVGRGRLCRRALVTNRPADSETTAQAIRNEVPEERCRSACGAALTNGYHERH